MTHWVKARSLFVRVLIYVIAAALAFALASGVGAMFALMVRGDMGLPGSQGSRPADETRDERPEQMDSASEREETATEPKKVASQHDQAAAADRGVVASQQDESEYVGTVGGIQSGAVEAFLESHEKLLRYDALAADDVEKMKANHAALQGMAERAAGLDPPPKYEEQHEVFASAIEELRGAAGLAHGMAADPVAAAELGFGEYDGRVDEASALLRRSNEMLGEDHEVPEGVGEVSPEF